MQEVHVQHYLQRATDMFDAMILLQDDRAYWNSSALLAIHSAISYSDALRAGLGDDKLASQSHDRAADTLLNLMEANYLDGRAGVTHLRFLLSKKNLVAYSAKRMEHSDYQALFTHAARFAKWAGAAAQKLKIAGWKYDD